jgi:hypothetical protein
MVIVPEARTKKMSTALTRYFIQFERLNPDGHGQRSDFPGRLVNPCASNQ